MSDPPGPDTFDDAADELYALAPEQFVARRDELVAAARRDGDRALAGRIAKLRRPTLAGWLVNLLARAEPDEVDALLALGAELRRAHLQLAGAELRALSRRRSQLTRSMAQRAAALARSEGVRVREDAVTAVARTLEAALADPDVADLVASGRVTSAESYSGFGPSGLPGSLAAVPDLPSASSTPGPSDRTSATRRRPARTVETVGDDAGSAEPDRARAAAREAAADALAAARTKAERAEGAADAARAEAADADQNLAEVKARIDELREQLSAAEEEHRFAERAGSAAAARRREADAALRTALDRVRAAQADLDEL